MARLRHREMDLPKIAQLEVAELLPDTRSIWLERSCSCKSFAAFWHRLAVLTVSCVCIACMRRGLEKRKLWRMCDKGSGLSPKRLLQGTCWVEKCVSQCWKVFLSPWALVCWWAMGAPLPRRIARNEWRSFIFWVVLVCHAVLHRFTYLFLRQFHYVGTIIYPVYKWES